MTDRVTLISNSEELALGRIKMYSCHCSDRENRLSISACKCKQSSGEFISLSRVECHQYS